MKDAQDPDAFTERFGPLARTMLDDPDLAAIWRLSFLANFWTGPIYATLQDVAGLGRPGFVVLFCLSRQDGLMARDIARLSGLPKNSVSRSVADLVERGFVEAAVATSDRRSKPLSITDRGRRSIASALPGFVTRQDAMLSALSPGEQDELSRLLRKMIDGLPEWVDDAGIDVLCAGPDAARP